MSKLLKVCVTILLACFFTMSISFAADQTKKRDRVKDQKKDKSCQSLTIKHTMPVDLAADKKRDRDRDRDRDKDGSCKS